MRGAQDQGCGREQLIPCGEGRRDLQTRPRDGARASTNRGQVESQAALGNASGERLIGRVGEVDVDHRRLRVRVAEQVRPGLTKLA